MKRTTLGLILAGTLMATTGLAQEMSLEDVLARHYQAIGGLEAWKAVQSMKATGKMTMGPGMEAPITMTAKRPNKIHIDFTVQGMTGSQSFDGETAWMVMPFMGKTDPEMMPQDQADNLKEEADLDGPLIGYQEDGIELELMGLEETAGTSAYRIKVTRKNGVVQHFFLDSEYFVPIRVEGTRTMQGKEMQFETILSDYKEVGGLMMAHSIDNRPKGAPSGQMITLDLIEVNVEVDDSFFAMPRSEKKEQP